MTKIKFIIMVFMFLTLKLVGQVDEGTSYKFPIKPNSKEWKSISSSKEMLSVCQIPEDILQGMNTVDLLQTCLTYPLKGNVYAYSNIKEGIEHISRQFNGFRELLLRKDNFRHLRLKFEQSRCNLHDNLFSDKNLVEKGEIMLDIALIESFLSFDSVLKNSDYNQKKQLAEVTEKMLTYKLQNKDKFGLLSITSTSFLLGKTMQKMNRYTNEMENTTKFLDNNIMVNDTILEEIIHTFKNAKL
ncbi:MAG: hypothetical protein ACK5KP_12695 [Paludibacteraceae bacterium]